ncbi:MAG: alanine dehydrogenase [Deltaproteobacteria bacterium]|nr:alanine dehydrogenase [Deltaproteobacteria bacterium]
MRVAIPRESFEGEARVAASPSAVRALVSAGHEVWVEQSAGLDSGFADDEYIRAGAQVAPTAEECFDRGELIWKVLRPSPHEHTLLRPGQRVAACQHAGDAYPGAVYLERMEVNRRRPVLEAMSEIAGRLAVEQASVALSRQHGGRGLLLGGVPGVEPARVVVIGAGTAGRAAAGLAAAVGAAVTVLDSDIGALRALRLPGVQTRWATPHELERALVAADVVIAAVRAEDGTVPRVASRAHLSLLEPGSVVVDLSIVDGGAFESTPVTTLDRPTAVVEGIVHVGVPNLAGGVPRTASIALSQASAPLVLSCAT